MSHVNETVVHRAEDLRGALAAESRAAACDRDLADHFEQRSLGSLASLCRRLATGHENAIESLHQAGAESTASHGRWLDDDARAFVLRVAGPRQLLGVALATETGVAELYDQMAEATTAHLAQRAHDAVREVSIAMESVPAAPDWEQLISSGAVPALALGAERRMRRGP